MIEIPASPVADNLTLTLIHFVWQGFLVGLVYWMLVVVLDLQSPLARYALSLSALLVMAIVPVVTFLAMNRSQPDASVMSHTRANSQIGSSADITYTDRYPSDAVAFDNIRLWFDALADQNLNTVQQSAAPFRHRVLETSRPYVLLLWLMGVVLSGARLAAGLASVVWLRAGRMEVSRDLLKSSQAVAHRIGLNTARVFASERVRVAAVVGFLKPVVLLPASWLCELPPSVLQAVIAHELAHIRRFDVWVNLLQRVLEALLFYHPVVWWLSNRVRSEREHCCDELAVQATGDRGRYAIALEQVGRLAFHGGRSLTPAVIGDSKMNLLNRIQHVLGISRRPHRDPSWLAGILAVGCSLAFAVAIGVHSQSAPAFAQEREGGRSPEAEAGDRPSPEAEAKRRRSPEADAGPRLPAEGEGRRSPEAEDGTRRSAEGERDGGRPAEGDSQTAILGFKPQTQREETLFQMIVQLQREVDALRREVSRGRGDGEAAQRYAGDRRDGDDDVSFDQFELPANWERTKEGGVFKAYDKNGDGIVSLDEWLAMTNGNISPARREISTGHFKNAEPSGDGKFTPAEFIWWRRVGSRQAAERAPQVRAGDGKSPPRQGPRDGDGPVRRGPRDGEGPVKTGPRDGERAAKEGPRDGA